MRTCKLLLIFTFVFVCTAPARGQEPTQPQQSELLRIITNPVIWRKDFRSVLTLLNDMKKIGEANVVVYADQAEGTRKFSATSGEALKEASELQLLIKENRSRLKPEILARLSAIWNLETPSLGPKAQPVRGEWESRAAVVLTERAQAPAELLSVEVTPAVLRQQIGEPESITKQVIDRGDERRPIILTLYHYAGDSIVFAVPEMSRTPGMVDRAFLDTQKVSELIFRP
jgi:hypothetical protein